VSIKKYISNIVIYLAALIGNTQEAVLCSLISDTFKIEHTENVPIVTSNSDDTINLTFTNQNVTNIFTNYNIYNFFQTFPNSSETLQKYYTITFDSKSLIEDMLTSVPTDIIEFAGSSTNTSNLPIKTGISQSILNSLDGNTYNLTKFIFTSDSNPCGNPCTLVDVPDTLSFTVSFNYNAAQEILYMESYEPTTCGNSFLIGLTGGNPNYFGNADNTLQLWESTPGESAIIESPQPCNGFELEVFSVLDIACNGYNLGNIDVQIDSETESFQFLRENMIFGYHIIEFSKANLSIEKESFNFLKPFEIDNNPYLHIANLNNKSISVEIYNTSGQLIEQIKTFEENTLDISNLTSGLYFIRLSNLNNQQKIFKFLKN